MRQGLAAPGVAPEIQRDPRAAFGARAARITQAGTGKHIEQRPRHPPVHDRRRDTRCRNRDTYRWIFEMGRQARTQSLECKHPGLGDQQQQRRRRGRMAAIPRVYAVVDHAVHARIRHTPSGEVRTAMGVAPLRAGPATPPTADSHRRLTMAPDASRHCPAAAQARLSQRTLELLPDGTRSSRAKARPALLKNVGKGILIVHVLQTEASEDTVLVGIIVRLRI